MIAATESRRKHNFQLTKMAKSGQRISHCRQAMQADSFIISTFSISLSPRTCLGQNATQIPQPLQRASIIFRLMSSPFCRLAAGF
jgi:hypothetical protein